MKLKSLELNEIGHIAESEIYRYIREIETNESQYLGGLLREIYEKSLQGMRFSIRFFNFLSSDRRWSRKP